MECPRLALYFASLLFSANLFAQSGLVAKPPPTKLDTPEAIAEFNVIYDVLQTNTRQQFPAITAQVAEFMKKYPDTSAAYAILGELKYRQFSLANSCGSMSDEVVMLASKALKRSSSARLSGKSGTTPVLSSWKSLSHVGGLLVQLRLALCCSDAFLLPKNDGIFGIWRQTGDRRSIGYVAMLQLDCHRSCNTR